MGSPRSEEKVLETLKHVLERVSAVEQSQVSERVLLDSIDDNRTMHRELRLQRSTCERILHEHTKSYATEARTLERMLDLEHQMREQKEQMDELLDAVRHTANINSARRKA